MPKDKNKKSSNSSSTTNDLKKLSRQSLVELLLELSKDNEALNAENQRLKLENENVNIAVKDAGNIAEASLKLQDIFAKAQEAADLYLANVTSGELDEEQLQALVKRDQNEMGETSARLKQLEEETRKKCDEMLQEAQSKLDEVLLREKEIVEAEELCEIKCVEMVEKAREEVAKIKNSNPQEMADDLLERANQEAQRIIEEAKANTESLEGYSALSEELQQAKEREKELEEALKKAKEEAIDLQHEAITNLKTLHTNELNKYEVLLAESEEKVALLEEKEEQMKQRLKELVIANPELLSLFEKK